MIWTPDRSQHLLAVRRWLAHRSTVTYRMSPQRQKQWLMQRQVLAKRHRGKITFATVELTIEIS
jgi:hypothetical protein